jgi:Uma2 family endonuclease
MPLPMRSDVPAVLRNPAYSEDAPAGIRLRYSSDRAMQVLIDQNYLPAMLTTGPLTDEQFAELCAEHEDLSFEMTADGELIVQPTPYNLTARREEELYAQLDTWAETDGRGYASGANQEFVLPNGARRRPDAAWVLKAKVARLPPDVLERYWRVCPDFVVELKSTTDKLATLRAKMAEWIANGAQLGWLIDPDLRTVEIYRPGAEVSVVSGMQVIEGMAPVEGFVLDVRPVWDPLG